MPSKEKDIECGWTCGQTIIPGISSVISKFPLRAYSKFHMYMFCYADLHVFTHSSLYTSVWVENP